MESMLFINQFKVILIHIIYINYMETILFINQVESNARGET